MFYDPDTKILYRDQGDAKKLGLPRVRRLTRPDVNPGETAMPNDLPHEESGEWVLGWTISNIPITKGHVNAERDRRIAAGFDWNGKTFQSDRDSRENISGAATSAVAYIVSGGSPDEVYWQSPDTPFVWIATDNTEVQMTPAQVIDFGNAAMAHKKAHIFAARTLKDMAEIPQDFTADTYWP